MLSGYIGKPVIDAAGLTGHYNVKLRVSREGLEGGRRDRGEMDLKLEQKKGAIEIIVVDKAEKTPTAN
jgi:uncharacterized protein (TIGR03435 family)